MRPQPEDYCRLLVQNEPTLVYGNGRCYAMFAYLRRLYGTKARPFYDGDHITTEIDGRHYDSRGEVTLPPNARPLAEYGPSAASQLRRNAERAA